MKEKKYKRVYMTLSFLLTVALVALATYFFDTHQKLQDFKTQDIVPQSEMDREVVKNEKLTNLLEIDNYWVETKDAKTTLKKYQAFLENNNQEYAKAINKRIVRLQNIIDSSKDDELAKINLRSELRTSNKRINSLVQVSDSINLTLNQVELGFQKKLDSLKNIIKEKDFQLQRSKTVKVISFRNEHKNLIHYIGETKNEMANGNGVGIWNTGSIYRGSWEDNMRHGKGEFVWEDNAKYEGDFYKSKRTGEGVFYYTSGEKYVGEFKEGLRNGEGILYDRDGNVSYDGKWKNDKPTQ